MRKSAAEKLVKDVCLLFIMLCDRSKTGEEWKIKKKTFDSMAHLEISLVNTFKDMTQTRYTYIETVVLLQQVSAV